MCAHLNEGQNVVYLEDGSRRILAPCTEAKALQRAEEIEKSTGTRVVKTVNHMPGKKPKILPPLNLK
ncbi:MAG: hypothetical protein U5L10_03415 [Candidatus Moranbacteria bacterium]|nr:hypothetical protein [Candidatus Moranbacteria bacterium]